MSTGSFTQLVTIKDTPDTGSEPNQLEATTLDSKIRQYIEGRQDVPSQTFTYNYTIANFTAVSAVCDGAVHYFLVVYQDGSATMITGTATTYKSGQSLDSVFEAKLVVTAQDIEDLTDADAVTALIS